MRFIDHLINSIEATSTQKKEELWDVSGILKDRSNQEFKFDVRPMFNMFNNQLGKKIKILNKADKIVFETKKKWIIIDVLELNEYVKKQTSKTIQFEDLLNKLDWNIVLPKK